jgi:hypothetical protein
MTVADIIKHLQTFPPDMEVWTTWDESGEYWPAEVPQGRVDYVHEVERRKVERRKGTRWEEASEPGEGKPVCVLLPVSDFLPGGQGLKR